MKNSIDSPIYNPLTPEKRIISLVREWSASEKRGDSNARQSAANEMKKYIVETDDGSCTLRSEESSHPSETMHTSHGGVREAQIKYVNPLRMESKKDLKILDICTGLGINAATVLEKFLGHRDKFQLKHITIDMVEVSWETLAVALLIPSPIKSHEYIKKAFEDYLIRNNYLTFQDVERKIPSHVDLHVHCQDARKMINGIFQTKEYDAIFLDPFSPAKSPELFSQEFIQKISELLNDDGMILTYTASAPARYALVNAGLEVGEGPAMGRKGGTIASSNPEKIYRPLNHDDERIIALSDVGIPYRDPELNSLPENIRTKRQKERSQARGETKLASTVKAPIYLMKDIDDEKFRRRVLKHLRKIGIKDLDSDESRYLVCPQFSECICHCKQERYPTSTARIKEMENRLKRIIKG